MSEERDWDKAIHAMDASYNMSAGGGTGAKREGVQAFVDGKSRDFNPYKNDTKERDQWFKGCDEQKRRAAEYNSTGKF
jgi:ribosome modulation factor